MFMNVFAIVTFMLCAVGFSVSAASGWQGIVSSISFSWVAGAVLGLIMTRGK